jgi:DNA-nicking Smr family endonuclease
MDEDIQKCTCVAGVSKENRSEDAELFRNAMKDVRPLATDKLVIRKHPPAPTPTQSRREIEDVLTEMANGRLDFDEIEYGDEAIFQRPGVSRIVMRKLRRGQFAVQAELDLHGLSIAEAKSHLASFIQHCAGRGMVCVRVIHGKGHRSPGKMPVLKPRVVRWLSQWKVVLAFTSARPVDGGTGALYVLLRRR